ncbi:hypothetical protein SCLCIDRAFT_169546 [Scleroderma citrinum Foug A]|uniref:Uncharacterized protein n=1 Tax=Scleroderma citrinum Foug A TaxID=1036808 RepID=A0A0C3ERP1_9AGAM|nr:hypothetical protein SCLCIDRAFT_169546 [Scleroderma citrinum Foug A]
MIKLTSHAARKSEAMASIVQCKAALISSISAETLSKIERKLHAAVSSTEGFECGLEDQLESTFRRR